MTTLADTPNTINELSPDQITILKAASIAKKFNLREATRKVYEAYRTFMGNSTFQAEVGIETICKMTGYCRNTVRKHLNILRDKGILWYQEQKYIKPDGGSWNRPHLYTFIFEKYGKQKQIKSEDKVVEVDKTAYQEEKEALTEAKVKLDRIYPLELADKAHKATLNNMRLGYTILNPFNYMKAIAEKMKASVELANDKDITGLVKSPAETKANSKKSRRTMQGNSGLHGATKFHNFEQRSSRYSKEDIDRFMAAKQEPKRPIDPGTLGRLQSK